MNRAKLKIVLLLTILSFPALLYADTVKLKSGKIVEGKIIENTAKYIKIEIRGLPFIYFLDEIEGIDTGTASLNKGPRPITTLVHKKDPKDIFKTISPAIVYIINKTLTQDECLGSGFIIDKSGLVVTNYHVMQYAKEINVKLRDGRDFPVSGVVYYSSKSDVCIFKIDASDLPVIPLGDSGNIEIGEIVYCIGNPLGLEYTFSNGMLSGTRDFQNLKWLQFTAPVSPGNSGGPLISPQGEAIGIVTFLLVGGQNLNFALGINEIKPSISAVPKMTFQQFVEKVSQADYYLAQGLQYCLINNFNQAVELFQKVLSIDPDSVEAYQNLAGVYCQYLNQCEKALPYLEKAIKIDPNNAWSHNDLGTYYFKSGQLQQAISCYKEAIRINPNEGMYYNNLGLAYIQLNNAQEALPCFQKAIEIDPNNGIYNNDAGLAYNKLGNYQQALAYLEKAVRMEPVCDNAYYNLAEAYYNLARPQEAISVLQYYIQAQPEDAAAWAYLGVILFDQGDIYNAKESLLNARQLYSEQGNYEGIQKVEEYLKKYDQNPLLPYNY